MFDKTETENDQACGSVRRRYRGRQRSPRREHLGRINNIRAAKAGLKIHEIPSHERRRIYGSSNLHAFRDGWRILKVIIRERLSRVREPDRRGLAAPAPAPIMPAVLAEAMNATREGR